MATLGQITANISERLLDPDNVGTSVSSVVNAVNASITYWKHRRFWFNEVTDTATLTQGSASFPYPSDFLMPVIDDGAFVVEYSNTRYPMQKITMQQYDGIYLSNGTGIPRFYARIANDAYQCYPLPDNNYIVRRHYLKDYTDLTDAAQTNDFTIHADRLIELWSLADLSGELRQDEVMENYYRNRATTEYNNLIARTWKMNGSGSLTLNSTLID